MLTVLKFLSSSDCRTIAIRSENISSKLNSGSHANDMLTTLEYLKIKQLLITISKFSTTLHVLHRISRLDHLFKSMKKSFNYGNIFQEHLFIFYVYLPLLDIIRSRLKLEFTSFLSLLRFCTEFQGWTQLKSFGHKYYLTVHKYCV